MSLENYSAIEETMYLLRSPQNAQRLYKALEQLKRGKYQNCAERPLLILLM